MRTITTVAAAAVIAAGVMAMAPQHSRSTSASARWPHADPAGTYEHLATAIIAIRETEDSFVHDMLTGYAASSRTLLDRAAEATGSDRRKLLEEAAAQITDLANEGDKRIQAVRQRLLKAGHHHNTDEVTDEDYMFIDSQEKSALLALAKEVSKMSGATPDVVREAGERFARLAENALKAE